MSKTDELHHWNYNLIEDFIIIDIKDHRKIHRYLTVDNQTGLFSTKNGVLLDTKQKHLDFINTILNN